MKINTKSVLTFKDKYINELKPEELDKTTYYGIISLPRYKKALDITETVRTNEEIATAYVLIEKAISDMENNKVPILIDNLLFAIAYPESFKLVRKYYDTLTTTCLNSKKFMKFDGKKFSPFQSKGEEYLISRIKQIEQSTYTLFIPLFNNDDILITEGGFNKRVVENMHYKYTELKNGEKVDLRDKNTALEIYTVLLDSSETLESVCKTFQISAEKVHQILKDYLKPEEYQAVLNILKNNSLRKYYEIKKIIERLYEYIPNGIILNDGSKYSFTMLYYYSITNLKPSTILEEIKNMKPSTKEEAIARARTIKYLHTYKNQGPFINREMLKQSNTAITRGNEKFLISDYADEICDTFKANNIPLYSELTDTAFKRLTRGQPIFPLLENKLQEEIKM